MNDELTFRIVFWIFLAFILIFNRIIPAYRAKKSDGRLLPDRAAVHAEGKFTFILRIILFVVFLSFLVLYSVDPPFAEFLHLHFPLWLRWSGTAIALLGVCLWVYAQAVLGRFWSPQLQLQKEHKIVTSGPYRVMRHPIYSAMVVWVIGLALFTANVVFVLLGLLTVVGLLARIPREEKMLIEQFGDVYKQYMHRTGRFFPRWR